VTSESGAAEQFRLPDGRSLCYTEYGDAHGTPAFYFHGFPGSRLEAQVVVSIGAERGVRVLAVDRPGFGRSDFQPGRTITDWPDDVRALADGLGLDRFAVLGVSGGAPYALACARFLADRLGAVGVASGLGPVAGKQSLQGMFLLNRTGLLLARRAPWLSPVIFASLTPIFRRAPGVMVARLAASATPPDRAFFADPERRSIFGATLHEAFHHGWRGPAHEGVLFGRPWGFRLDEIAVPVHLWHGERDRIVPPAIARATARAVPDCRAVFYPEEGHFSAPVNQAEQILAALLAG
jgi:pimeloyl-ACP methyl ester carboxylesterase